MKSLFTVLFSLFVFTAHAYEGPGQISCQKKKDIVELAMETPATSTLVNVIKAAGLVDALKGKGPFTVFAPTNEAFAKIPQATLDSLLQDKEKLKEILLYHVYPGEALASLVTQLDEVETLNGKTVDIDLIDGNVFLNQNSKVIKTDIKTKNGVIHLIDTVLIP